jgi:hypothetical protein
VSSRIDRPRLRAELDGEPARAATDIEDTIAGGDEPAKVVAVRRE